MNQVLIDWGDSVREWEDACMAAAQLKAIYDHAHAGFMQDKRKDDPKLPVSGAELLADSDPGVHEKNLARLEAEARVDGIRKRLDWYEARSDAARTTVANEREEARVWASAPIAPGQEPQKTGDWT